MKSRSRSAILVAALVVPLFAMQASAQLEVEIDFDGSVQPVIVDNGAGDLNATADIIDFDITDGVNPDLSARGRVQHESGLVGELVEFTAITPDANGVLRNNGAADADFTLTIRSATYLTVGPPLGWALRHDGEVADPLPDVVSVTNQSSTLSVDNEVVPLQTVLVPDIADVGDPPIPIYSSIGRGSDPAADATSTQAVLTMTLGPGDEYHSQAEENSDFLLFLAHVFNQELKCVIKMNQQASKAMKIASKVNEKCVKNADHSPALACVKDPVEGMDSIEDKIVDKFFTTFCVAPPPAWGANVDSCCEDSANEGAGCSDNADCSGGSCLPGGCIAGAQNQASDGLVFDLFGSTVDVDTTESCSSRVHKAADKAVAVRWTGFFKCKKTNIQSINDDVDLVAQCLTGTEADTKAASAEAKISDAVADCSAPVATTFPGICASASPFDGCVIERTRCRFCQSTNQADDIDPPFDCDLFDNAAADLSCADEVSTTTTTTLPPAANICCSLVGQYCGFLSEAGCDSLGLTVGGATDVCDSVTGNCQATASPGSCCLQPASIEGVACVAGPAITSTNCTDPPINGSHLPGTVCASDRQCE